jgi:hypothetical protein
MLLNKVDVYLLVKDFYQKCHGSQARKLVFAKSSGLKRVGEEVKLVSLVLQVQVVCDRMEGWGEELELLTFARLPNDKYP